MGVSTERLISHEIYASAASPDGIDAPGDEESSTKDANHSLARRTRTFMKRHAIFTVISVLRADAVVIRVVRHVLRFRRSAAGRILDQMKARVAAEMAVQLARSEATAGRSALQRQTGGSCLAAVLAGGAIAESMEQVSAADGFTGSQSLGAREKTPTTGPAASRHDSAALHDGVASSRIVRMAVHACGDGALPSVSSQFGTVLACHHFVPSSTAAQRQVSVAKHPRPLDSSLRPRDAFRRLFAVFDLSTAVALTVRVGLTDMSCRTL